MKTIAVDIDDTLNNFSETLQQTDFQHGPEYALTAEAFQNYLHQLKTAPEMDGDLLSTEYSYFRYKIHHACYTLATPRADGIEFMQWLRSEKWRIVICTNRDLRRSNDWTREWLGKYEIPFDYLFLVLNKPDFCKAWGIDYLVDDHLFSALNADHYGLDVFYPIMSKHSTLTSDRARGFNHFDEIKQWIAK